MPIIILAIILNLPYIIIQRYNRPRILTVLEKMEQHQQLVSKAC